ncbi:MAG: hypothetical protein F9K29_21365 [Hyphomicrobiaceae bacterium]|nr:MAG: hypothetical protein F9K29_21365 [Hyphomicrobiaceae bacterium]
MLARLCPLAALLVLTSCAAAVPGYTPPSFKEKSKFGTALQSGEVGSDGRYQLSKDEKAMDCRRMTGSMQITIARLRDADTRGQPSALASASQKAAAPIFSGSTVGADRQADYARERAKLAAYNRQLADKNCKTVDIEAELARKPESRKY